jgi:hypothetical protein
MMRVTSAAEGYGKKGIADQGTRSGDSRDWLC